MSGKEGESPSPDRQNAPEPSITSEKWVKKKSRRWEYRLGWWLALSSFIAVGGSFALAVLWSVYRSVSSPPKVWGKPKTTLNPRKSLSISQIKTCANHLKELHREQLRETTALWFRISRGHRGYLTLWQEWSRDWTERLNELMDRCPFANPEEMKKLRPTSLEKCYKNGKKLWEELEKKSKSIWEPKKHGGKHFLQNWREWSEDWKNRMNELLLRCPIYGPRDIAKAFYHAYYQMLKFQKKQEKMVFELFSSSLELFRDLRQSLHKLREELR